MPVVRCRDYGIGMDEYIIRNYLSIAGTSYYQSSDFKNQGLKMDPHIPLWYRHPQLFYGCRSD